MTTGTYTIDATNNAEPLDTRFVADFPAELRAMKTRMNSAISSIGSLTGALMADGTNYMTGKLGIGGVASASLMLHLYGNARMEGTVTVVGKQDITGIGFGPGTGSVVNAASTVRGGYGGGYVMIDGATYGGTWLASGSLFFGLGTSSGLVEKVKVATNDFQFTSDAQSLVTSKAASGWAGFHAKSSGNNPGYIFFGNDSGECARIVAPSDSSMYFCAGLGAEPVFTLNPNKSASFYGSEISIGVGTPGEKRMRFYNEYGSPYLFMNSAGDIGIFDPITGIIRSQFFANGLFQSAGDAYIGYPGHAAQIEMRLFNSNRQVSLLLEGGGSNIHLWDVTGNRGLWTSNISGDFIAAGDVAAYSDAKLKHDVKTLDNALDTVQQLRGVSYKWNRDNSPGIGFIAQEVEAVCPELVLDGTHKSITYGNITAILVEAVKELRAEILDLRIELAALKARG